MNPDKIIKELSERVGIPELSFIEKRVVTFQFNDQYTTNIEKSEDEMQLTVYGIVAELPFDSREEFLLSVLEANIWGLQTEGATFAMDADRQELILFRNFKVRDLQFEEFYGDLQKFLRIQQEWSEKLEAREYAIINATQRRML